MAFPTRFDPQLYREFRPEYPADLFERLARIIAKEGRIGSALDVGCGTGRSLDGLTRAFSGLRTVVGVDRDPAMLEAARREHADLEFRLGRAEELPAGDGEFDLVMVASALHWFERERFAAEAARVLRGDGFLLVAEYQFPRARAAPALNEWIRRRFNRDWKAPGQSPRGSLRDLTAVFGEPAWRSVPFAAPDLVLSLGPAELCGQIVTQSRYLHSETGLSDEQIAERREMLRSNLDQLFGPARSLEFDFYLRALLFQKRP